MAYKNTVSTFGSVSKWFHWTIFFLVVAMLLIGYFMDDFSRPVFIMLITTHKMLGLLILMLMCLRLLWALFNPKPALPEGATKLERYLVWSGHALLYMVLFIMPLTGWFMSTASGHIPSFYGLFSIPMPGVSVDRALAHVASEFHEITAVVLIVLVIGHVLAALYHHYIRRDDILLRMMPGANRRK